MKKEKFVSDIIKFVSLIYIVASVIQALYGITKLNSGTDEAKFIAVLGIFMNLLLHILQTSLYLGIAFIIDVIVGKKNEA